MAFVAAGAAVLSRRSERRAIGVIRDEESAARPSTPRSWTSPGQGYVEEEFFIQGTAHIYDIPRDQMSNGTPADATHPFKTRIVVRRPASAARFNGTVVVEWTNVSEGFDNEVEWFHSGEHFVRAGYAWVGVSAQNVGVSTLKQRNADRYSSLDVTDGGTVMGDALSYDIFSAAGAAVRGKGGVNVMGRLKAERLIASGHSQSAGRLATYFNAVHPLAPVYDAVLLHGGGGKMRTDLTVKIWKLLSETDVLGQVAGAAARHRQVPHVGGRRRRRTSTIKHATELVKLGLRSRETMLPNSTAGASPAARGAAPRRRRRSAARRVRTTGAIIRRSAASRRSTCRTRCTITWPAG